MVQQTTAREGLARVNDRIQATQDPLQRARPMKFRDHWWGEVIGDVDLIMSTMSLGPIRYTFDGNPFLNAEGVADIVTHQATRAMYQAIVDMGLNPAGPMDGERIFHDDRGLTSPSSRLTNRA